MNNVRHNHHSSQPARRAKLHFSLTHFLDKNPIRASNVLVVYNYMARRRPRCNKARSMFFCRSFCCSLFCSFAFVPARLWAKAKRRDLQLMQLRKTEGKMCGASTENLLYRIFPGKVPRFNDFICWPLNSGILSACEEWYEYLVCVNF